jgi:hypothetical protein
MVLISLTEIDEQSNLFFSLLGVLALSLSYEKVGGCVFSFDGNPLSDPGVPRWKRRDTEEEQPHRLHPRPTEDIARPERVPHTANARAIWVNSVVFTQMAPTTGRIGLTFNGAAHPYVQLASEFFSAFPSVRAEKPVPVTGSQLFLLLLNVINVISGAQIPGRCTSESSAPNLYSRNQKF